MKIKNFFKSQAGFTLIELLVVIGIIAVLSTIGAISFGAASARARDAKRAADIRTIQSGLEIFNSEIGNYPAAAGANGIAWIPFLTSLRISNIMPPQAIEDYCYFTDFTASATRYLLVATDFERDVPDISVQPAGNWVLISESDSAVSGTCTAQAATGVVGVAIGIAAAAIDAADCALPTATTGNLCIVGGI